MPESLTGSSTATGVRAPVRPTWTTMSLSRVVACRAGNLNEIAQRGNLAVTPSVVPLRRRVDLDHDAVHVIVERVPLFGPFLPVGDDLVRGPAEAGMRVGLESERFKRLKVSHWLSGSRAVDEQGIEKDVELPGRDLARIEEPDRARRGVPRVGEKRLVPRLALPVDPAEGLEGQIDLAADLDRAALGDASAAGS